jgi:hypothetical protein
VAGEIFRTRQDRPWGPPSLLYNGYRVIPGGKTAGAWRGADHPPSSSAEVKERVELYLYSPSGPSWPVLGKPLPLPLPLQCPSSEKQISTLPTRFKFWCPLLFTKIHSVPTYSFCRHSYTGHTQNNGAVFV